MPSPRTRNIYNPKSDTPFKISRTKIDLFLKCPRCFYLDRRLGVARPGFPAFSLNIAVDALLKKEFDIHRANGTPHALIKKYGVDARPIPHQNLDAWRANFTGVQYLHEPTNLIVTGAIDDLWQNSRGEYIVVDYKATAKDGEITELSDSRWHVGYKRQIEVYQWLLRRNGLLVSPTGYFVYCNGRTDREAFNGKLEFDIALIPYVGNDDWVESTVLEIHKCLNDASIPDSSPECDYCTWLSARMNYEK